MKEGEKGMFSSWKLKVQTSPDMIPTQRFDRGKEKETRSAALFTLSLESFRVLLLEVITTQDNFPPPVQWQKMVDR